jgi:hypothetical protein
MRCKSCGSLTGAPVIISDIDGTLAIWEDHFIGFLKLWLPPSEAENLDSRMIGWSGDGEFSDHLELDKATYRQAKLQFRQGGYKRWMPAYAGAASMTATAKLMGASVWITTTRPWLSLDNIDPDTRHWLARNGIAYDHLIFSDDKYEAILERVGASVIVAAFENEKAEVERGFELGLPMVQRSTNWNAPPMPLAPNISNLFEGARMIEQRLDDYWRANA